MLGDRFFWLFSFYVLICENELDVSCEFCDWVLCDSCSMWEEFEVDIDVLDEF